MPTPTREQFIDGVRRLRADQGNDTLVVPIAARVLEDQLTPVLAYRRLVAPDERTAPSFLFESVEGGERQGRHSILGARPALEVIAEGHHSDTATRAITVLDHRAGTSLTTQEPDPLEVLRRLSRHHRLVHLPLEARRDEAMPRCLLGGWVGYAAYDTARYAEPEKLGVHAAPPDDRGLPELQFAYYDGVVVFDHVEKLVSVVKLAELPPGASDEEAAAVYNRAVAAIDARVIDLQTHSKPLPLGRIAPRAAAPAPAPLASNLTREQHAAMLARAKEYIRAGDVFQVVLGQRFEKISPADPFDVYRALRTVNPSPYMVYLQGQGVILIASSPEILCRVRRSSEGNVLTNRPLAGTRRRGSTAAEDAALEKELLSDPKERAEHIMLVDLGRNDVGKVCEPGSIQLPVVMNVERYSHVMHISSTVTGTLRDGLDCWDALRATLPVGTISGAPKIRAMQIIDELEPVRRGPYGGGIGYVSLDGDMDIALALRTMVVPTAMHTSQGWTYHLQAAGGIVADSDPAEEYQETVNKAAALARAIEVAEQAFGSGPGDRVPDIG